MYAGTVLRHGRLQFSVPVMVRRRSENPPCIETLNIRHHRLPEEWKDHCRRYCWIIAYNVSRKY